MQMTGRLVLVTGASSGIGAATARLAASRGARVLLLARSRQALEDLASDIRAKGGTAWPYPVDLADIGAVASVCRAIEAEVGTPDVVVNNAGAGRWLAIDETEPAEAVQMMAVPYLGAFAVSRAFVPGMLRRGSGHLANLTSPAAYLAIPGSTAYSVARWAMRGFSEALRADLAGTGIGVSLIVPGKVSSAYFDNNPGTEARVPWIARMFRTVSPEEVASAILRAVERGQREAVFPFLLRATLFLNRLAPRLVGWAVERTGWRRPAPPAR